MQFYDIWFVSYGELQSAKETEKYAFQSKEIMENLKFTQNRK